MDEQTELPKLRAELDVIDRRLIEVLVDRLDVVHRVAQLKAATGRVVRDPTREAELVERLKGLARDAGLDPHFVVRIMREILDHSVRVQEDQLARRAAKDAGKAKLRVGYQGGEGAFSHMCAQRHFGARSAEITYEGYPSFRAMLEAVRHDTIDFAMLPIENSIAGSINESYDLLAEMDLFLVGEELQPIVHCLIGFPEVEKDRIRRIYSHPVALAQCGSFLRSLEDCRAEAFVDTALAVEHVREQNDLSQAAIASEEAARVHGLVVIEKGVADQPENYTRMVVVGREPAVCPPQVAAKTSLYVRLSHEKGSLARCIEHFARRGLNLTKLESRPIPDAPFEYAFYVDFEGNIADEAVAGAVDDLDAETATVRVLGSYPMRTRG